MNVQPRYYQLEQVANASAIHARGVRSVLVEAATGTGKTTTSGLLVSQVVAAGGRALFLAHRGELLAQAKRRFEADFGLAVGVEQGSRRAGDEPVVVASVQTMRGERLMSWSPDAFDMIIVDECHHAPSPSYRAILDYFHTARVVGVTATVDRADGIPLGTVFQEVAHRYGIERAIEEGFLCKVRGVQVTVPGLDLSKVRHRRQTINGSRERPGETIDLLAPAGQARLCPLPNGKAKRYSIDLHPTDLGAAVLEPAAVSGIVEPMLALVNNRRTIVFAVDINHAQALADEVNRRRPGQARVVHGDTRRLKKQERAAIQAAHQAGEFQFLINCMLLTEGYDDPAIGCVVMARPTMSRVLYCQAVGRALRPHDTKDEALLLDFVGVGCKFNLVGPEDALGNALVGSVLRISAANPGRVERVRRALMSPVSASAGDVGDWLADLFRPRPRARAGGFITRAVELVRRTVRRARGWLAKIFAK